MVAGKYRKKQLIDFFYDFLYYLYQETEMEYEFVRIDESEEIIMQAAEILYTEFAGDDDKWFNNTKESFDEVKECIEQSDICIGIKTGNELIGWASIRPMYEKTWELHSLVIKKKYHGKKYGKILLNEIEKKALLNGIIGLVAGADDVTNSTSLSDKEINGENIFEEIKNIKNYKNHPFEFYIKCGYNIIGIVPNANGQNKPDIWLWKDIRK